MTARQIALHRYGDYDRSTVNAEHELVSQYRQLLIGDSEHGSKFDGFVKLVPPLLECQSAHLLYLLNDGAREISRSPSMADGTIVLDDAFARYIGTRETVIVQDTRQAQDLHEMEWARNNDGVVSFMSCRVKTGTLSLCLLVATDCKPRLWTSQDFDRLKDVSNMLSSNLEVAHERQLISVQRRMQRSLVQFVRGNLPVQEDGVATAVLPRRTTSLYSDLDEDLEADDADDETESVETSRMNVMFDFSARLIRRTLKVAGCLLLNIENLTDMANIQADIPLRSTIMGTCFLKHLRTKDWHDVRSAENSKGTKSTSTISADSAELQSRNVERRDVYDPCGLSGSWLRQLLEAHPRAVTFNEHNLPDDMVTLLPAGIRSCLLSPIYDSNAKAFALIIVFDDKPGEFSKADCHYIEAFGSSIYAEVLNQSLQKANEAKALFISKISHEFRTPLHGILASAEFLNDMVETTPAQIGFVQTIDTCGRTLLDVINHVLDYSKLSFSKDVLAAESSSKAAITFEDFDIVEVAEQVLMSAFSAYEFKRINEHLDVQKSNSQPSQQSDSDSGNVWGAMGRNVEVIVLARARPQGYLVHSDLGAFRRIVLNLLGNALKYTHTGHVTLELEMTPNTTQGLENLRISVSDSGIGISSSFLAEMFRPFTQEDDFSTGTGLGLSIVKELCNKMHGKIEVQSRKHKGSAFSVEYPVIPIAAKPTLFPGDSVRRELRDVRFYYHEVEVDHSSSQTTPVEDLATTMLRSSIVDQLQNWFGMQEVQRKDAEIIITDDITYQSNPDALLTFNGPVLTFCSTTTKYEKGMRRRSLPLQVFVTKPCGPNKLGACVTECINKARNISRLGTNIALAGSSAAETDFLLPRRSSTSPAPSVSSNIRPERPPVRTNITGGSRRTIREEQDEQTLAEMYSMHSTSPRLRSESQPSPLLGTNQDIPDSPTTTFTQGPRSSRRVSLQAPEDKPPALVSENSASKKHILIVEDNAVNMMLLVAFAKRQRLTVSSAVNGAVAVERVKDRGQNFDVILMDINMPVMNGFQAMKSIRKFEKSDGREPSKIVALTGLSTPEDQERAQEAGSNAFFTKPVKMAELRALFEEWDIIVAPDVSTTESLTSHD